MNLDAIGGRKFVLTLICVGVGTAVELYTNRGVTPAFAGLLATLVAAFGAANAFNTKQYLEADTSAIEVPDLTPAIQALETKFDTKVNELGHQVEAALTVTNGLSDTIAQVGAAAENAKKLM